MAISREQVAKAVERLKASINRDECWNCDCMQGFLTQLELDAEEDVADLVAPMKAARSEMHGCLGCDPCPPGALFAEYLRFKQDIDQQELK